MVLNMDQVVTLRYIHTIAPHFDIRYLTCFSREYLLLDDVQIRNALNNTDESLYEKIYTGLRIWSDRRDGYANVNDLYELLLTACKANTIRAAVAQTLEMNINGKVYWCV